METTFDYKSLSEKIFNHIQASAVVGMMEWHTDPDMDYPFLRAEAEANELHCTIDGLEIDVYYDCWEDYSYKDKKKFYHSTAEISELYIGERDEEGVAHWGDAETDEVLAPLQEMLKIF